MFVSAEGGVLSLTKLASHPGYERGLIMKPDKVCCCMFSFDFSALAVRKTQFVQISLLSRDSDIRYRNSMCEVPCTLRRRSYRLSHNLFPNERWRDECSPKAD